jgi:hypothetical protein
VENVGTSGITADNEDSGGHTTDWPKHFKRRENMLSIDSPTWGNGCIVLYCTEFNWILEVIGVKL